MKYITFFAYFIRIIRAVSFAGPRRANEKMAEWPEGLKP
jgi:hypothetical protein